MLLASFLTSSTWRAERRSGARTSLLASLIISFSPIRSTLLAFSAFISLAVSPRSPWITQTWLKPSDITTGKRNLVLGIRLLYLPITVVICSGKHTYTHSSAGIFSLLRYQETPRVLKMRTVAPFFPYTAACRSLCVSDLFYPALKHPPAHNNKILRKENFYHYLWFYWIVKKFYIQNII